MTAETWSMKTESRSCFLSLIHIFKDGVKQANEYAYDANGNLTKDLNKGITNISYNCLNLPSVVTFSDGLSLIHISTARISFSNIRILQDMQIRYR